MNSIFRQSLNIFSHLNHVQENFNYSRRRSRAILNELSGKYFQNKRPGRQKLLERMYSNCESTTLPIYKPSQLEVSKFRLIITMEHCPSAAAEFPALHHRSLWNVPEMLGLCHPDRHPLCRHHRAL